MQGRKPHVTGHPAYLEENEFSLLRQMIVEETTSFHPLKIKEVGVIVFFFF
jgi:hypothetical protein